MIKAFGENDYGAWKKLNSGRGRVAQVINSQNFARFAETHRLILKGRIAEANAIRAELGLGLHNGTGNRGLFGWKVTTNR